MLEMLSWLSVLLKCITVMVHFITISLCDARVIASIQSTQSMQTWIFSLNKVMAFILFLLKKTTLIFLIGYWFLAMIGGQYHYIESPKLKKWWTFNAPIHRKIKDEAFPVRVLPSLNWSVSKWKEWPFYSPSCLHLPTCSPAARSQPAQGWRGPDGRHAWRAVGRGDQLAPVSGGGSAKVGHHLSKGPVSDHHGHQWQAALCAYLR